MRAWVVAVIGEIAGAGFTVCGSACAGVAACCSVCADVLSSSATVCVVAGARWLAPSATACCSMLQRVAACCSVCPRWLALASRSSTCFLDRGKKGTKQKTDKKENPRKRKKKKSI